LCEEKLATAHPVLADWFHTVVKPHFPRAHVSWAFRNKEEQLKAFNSGKSELKFPNSKHNKTDSTGALCAEALDLFEILPSGIARFEPMFYADVANYSESRGWSDRVKWGLFNKFGKRYDLDHYSLVCNFARINEG
jgi:hypothetical protein